MVVAKLVMLGVVIVGTVSAVDKSIIKLMYTNLKYITMYGILIITNKMLMENNSYYYNLQKCCTSVIMKNISYILTIIRDTLFIKTKYNSYLDQIDMIPCHVKRS